MKHFFFIVSLLIANISFSMDRFVDPSLSNGNGTTLFTSITSAINASQNGDNIFVAAGIYSEQTLTINKSLKIMPYIQGGSIQFNQNVVIAGIPNMELEITGFSLGNYSFSGNTISNGTPSSRAKVSIINCSGKDIEFSKPNYFLNILENNLTSGIIFSHGNAIKNTTKYLILADEFQNNPLTTDNNLIVNNLVTYLIGIYNNDYPFIIANNLMRDLSVRKWNANTSVTNKIINNDFANDATINFSVLNVPYYNFIFSSNKFLGSFYGLAASACGSNNSDYNISPLPSGTGNPTSYYDYQFWMPTWGWCCNGPFGWYCANYPTCSTTPTRPPNFNCYQWILNGSSSWPNFNTSGFFQWTYNGVDLVGAQTGASILNFTKVIGPTSPVDGGNIGHDYYDIDLTINDRGRSGGPRGSFNYFNFGVHRAQIYNLEMSTDLYSNIELDITASAYHRNFNGTISASGLLITGAEYYFGTFDPGEGNGTPIITLDAGFDSGVEDLYRSQATWGNLPNPTLFNIRVKDANGTWGPLFKKTVFPYGANPSVQLINQGDTISVCPSSPVTLTYSGPNGYVPTWFNGSNANEVTFTPVASGYYSVSAILGNSSYEDSIYVEFLQNPSPIINTSGSILVCASSAIILSTPQLPNTIYRWYFNNNPISGASNISYLPTQVGTYYVQATSSLTGCSSQSENVILFSSFSISPSGQVTSSCSTPVTLSAPIGNGNTYQWKLNGSSISGATAPSYSATQTGSYSVTLTNNSCSSTSQSTVISFTGAPNVPTITASGPTTFCSGGSVTLTSSSVTGNTWSNGSTSQSITVSTADSYSVVVTNGNCSSSSNPTTVSVNQLPGTPTIIANGPTTFCSGGSVTLTSSSATGNTWSNGSTSQSITVSTADSYSVVVTNGNCSSSSNPTTVSVNQLPGTPTIIANGPTTFCSGGSVTLTSSSATGNTWSNGSTSQSITVSTDGSYSVVVSNGDCSSLSSNEIVVQTTPSILWITQPINQNAAVNTTIQFNAEVSNTNASYQWQTNTGSGFQNVIEGGQFSGSTSNFLTISNLTLANNNQEFRCIVNSGACEEISSLAILTVNSTVGILKESMNESFNIYPNPASSLITIEMNKIIYQTDLSVRIVNSLGQLVYFAPLSNYKMTILLDEKEWNGLYLISIINSKQEVLEVKKIVFQ